jgi:formylglycine-generating enzyme required for sulfatase activity/uncharacterized RDD family membrane protein YckC
MSHDVFISYSSKDKNAGDAVCAVLERNGVRCWIAPRDVVPGMVWGSAIVSAIHGAKVMVLVFSGAANTSPQIEREVERAISKGIPVIPFRIEDVQPSDSLEYFISASHWLDAFTAPLEQHLETLARVVRRIIEVKLGKEGGEGAPAKRQAADAAATVELATAPAGVHPPGPGAPASPRGETGRQPIEALASGASAGPDEIARTSKLGLHLLLRWVGAWVDFLVIVLLLMGPDYFLGNKLYQQTLAVWLGIIVLYFLIGEGLWGRTLGKLLTGMVVVDKSGHPPGIWKSGLRTILRLIEVNPLLVGGIPAAIVVALSQRRQRIGDMLAQTYVVRVKDLTTLATAPAGVHPPGPVAPAALAPPSRWRYFAATAALATCVALAALFFIWESRKNSVAGSRQVGEIFRDCAECPEMVVVPAGHFMMGAAQQEQSSDGDDAARERPRHEVRFERPFAVGIFAVTREQFEEFVRRTNNPMEGGCSFWDGSKEAIDPARSFRDPRFSGGPQAGDHPVVCVSEQEASKFASWPSGKTGHHYRLLSEAEREYVTRAGTTTAFWWGPSISADQANYWSDRSYNGSPTTPARFATLPVKSFRPNPWGLYQVHGNVTEWVADCPHPDYTGAPSDGTAWPMATGRDCNERLARSGSFMNSPVTLRSAQRRFFPDMREISIGFRVAQTLAN